MHTEHPTQPTEHVETVIVGAGQAGLATGYHLQRQGRPFVILDGASRVGDGWRHQWDSLRLFSPAWADGLPGKPYPGPRWSFPTKDEFADYLEAYAAELGLPIRLDTHVVALNAARDGAEADGRFVVTTDRGQLHADNVVVATGTFGRTPLVPDFADQLDPSILQLHSSEYRRPGDLPPGPVLVVGASHSGCDIAYELAETHPTILAGRDTGQIPVPFTSPRAKVVLPIMLFAFGHVLTRRTPIGRKAMEHFRFHGGPRLRVQARDLAEHGVEWVKGRVTGVEDGRPVLDGRGAVDVRTVIWCTGFRQRFTWIGLDILDERGWPRERSGVVDEVPGLYFMGLAFQSSARSTLIRGARDDAARVVKQIVGRAPSTQEYRREMEESWASTSSQPDGRRTPTAPGPRPAST